MLNEYDVYGSLDNSVLNRDISAEEVLKAVKSLKSGTSCGIDEISNEMLKMSVPELSKCFPFLFNFILQSNTYPAKWKENVIRVEVLQIQGIIGVLLFPVVLVN